MAQRIRGLLAIQKTFANEEAPSSFPSYAADLKLEFTVLVSAGQLRDCP
jgi:hypothetical protein